MPLIYKTLFEIKLTHEFYVTKSDGSTLFSLPGQPDRIGFLLDQYKDESESVNTDVSFKFPEILEEKYAGYNLKLLPAYSGFKVAVRVKQHILPDNSLVYEPIALLPKDLDINIIIAKKNNLIDSYTNSKLYVNVPGLYFFSNDEIPNSKTFPFLCNNISSLDPGNFYEQGELASFGTNDIRENYKTGSITAADWHPVRAGTSFVNENDRLLLPLRFFYAFRDADDITAATFTLKDNSGKPVKEIKINNDIQVKKALLDFSDKADLLTNKNSFSFTDMIFSLNATGTNGYSKNHEIIFSDSLYNKAYWGIINIKVAPTDSAFKLIADDGFLIKRKDSSGAWTEPPVFEIPVKSRFTYWRYVNDLGKELGLSADLKGCLLKEGKMLISNNPRAIAKNYFSIPKTGTSKDEYVPNPTDYTLKIDDKGRWCFDVIVPASGMFAVP